MLEHSTALVDAATPRGTSRALSDGLTARSIALVNMGRGSEAAGDARRALAVARESRDRAGELFALGVSAFAARGNDDLDHAVQFARQAAQITDGVPGWFVRWSGYVLTGTLVMAGDLAAADEICALALARSRDVGDLTEQEVLLPWMVQLDLHAGRAQDAAAHLREGLQISLRSGGRYDLLYCLDGCGYLCAETGRLAEAITIWAAFAVLLGHGGSAEAAPALVRRRAVHQREHRPHPS